METRAIGAGENLAPLSDGETPAAAPSGGDAAL